MRISVIIVTYNRSEALALILKSVSKQKSLPFEVIVADDGSGPETKVLVDNLQKSFPVPLKHVWHEDKGFRGAAIRNKAIKKSSGDCLLFSDGDLVFHPKFFYDFSRNMKPGKALIGSRVFIAQKASEDILLKKTLPKVPFTSPIIEKNRLNAIRIPGISKLFPAKNFTITLRGGLLCAWKKDIIEINGWNEDFEGWGKEDTEIVARLSFKGIKLKKLKFAGITYHLWHKFLSRKKVPSNELLLTDCIIKHNKWCRNGLVKS
ncbi:MAG TPA: glycosyltransferase family 2 protein [Prolixibacteraceae bacterium]|nr:glycosyltransferase family 2 protein [Prolixibacteraceae bacterium]